jgi:hypothetical protein
MMLFPGLGYQATVWVIVIGLPLPLTAGLIVAASCHHAPGDSQRKTTGNRVLAALDALLRLACWMVFVATAVTVSSMVPGMVRILEIGGS